MKLRPRISPSTTNETFSIRIAKVDNERVQVSMEDELGTAIIPATELTLGEAFRMIRLEFVKGAYPISCHDRLLRGDCI